MCNVTADFMLRIIKWYYLNSGNGLEYAHNAKNVKTQCHQGLLKEPQSQ